MEWGNSGMVEYWEKRPILQPIVPIFHCSIIPILLSPSAGGRLCQDFRPRRASLRSYARTEPTGPKPTRPEKGRARLATPLNRLFSSRLVVPTGIPPSRPCLGAFLVDASDRTSYI
jgi:hypothetical protein